MRSLRAPAATIIGMFSDRTRQPMPSRTNSPPHRQPYRHTIILPPHSRAGHGHHNTIRRHNLNQPLRQVIDRLSRTMLMLQQPDAPRPVTASPANDDFAVCEQRRTLYPRRKRSDEIVVPRTTCGASPLPASLGYAAAKLRCLVNKSVLSNLTIEQLTDRFELTMRS
jgi:hypothetical protein